MPEQDGHHVDLIIAVHNAKRPIGRAVKSVAESGLGLNVQGGVRVTVVCHNVNIREIAARIPADLRDEVRYIELHDGIPSPAGPLNMGLDHATAPYSSVMGSDDALESGALGQWLRIAEKYGSDAVIAPERHADGRKVRTPVARIGRARRLDPVKDRLIYRTAPLGLIRTDAIRRMGLRFSEGLRTGEDQEFSAKLWFGARRIDYAAGSGQYVVGSDAGDRVTYTRRPVSEELQFIIRFLDNEWFLNRADRERRAIATKLIRVHIFSLVLTRYESGGWSQNDVAELALVLGKLLDVARGAASPLSIADRRLIDAILAPEATEARLVELARARRRFGNLATLIPSRFTASLDPESPLRFLPASALLR